MRCKQKLFNCRPRHLLMKNMAMEMWVWFLPARYMQSVTPEMVFTLCFFRCVVFVTAIDSEAIKQTQSTAKCVYPSSSFSCMILAKIEKCA